MGRPANADGRQTRAAVMNAALDLFSQKGYFGTSLRDIASVVGVRESALYNYFSSKEQLFEALITAASEERSDQLHEITEGPVDGVISDPVRGLVTSPYCETTMNSSPFHSWASKRWRCGFDLSSRLIRAKNDAIE